MKEFLLNNWKPIAIGIAVVVTAGLVYATGYTHGSSSGFSEGYTKGMAEVSCDGGTHIPDAWKGKPVRKDGK